MATQAAHVRRPSKRQAEAAFQAQAPVPNDNLSYPHHTAHVGWDELEAELPGLHGWVTDHGPEILSLAERIRTGTERRAMAIRQEDTEVLEAIDEKLAELRGRIRELDYGAKRALVITALMYLRQVAGPCFVAVSAHDGEVEISVR